MLGLGRLQQCKEVRANRVLAEDNEGCGRSYRQPFAVDGLRAIELGLARCQQREALVANGFDNEREAELTRKAQAQHAVRGGRSEVPQRDVHRQIGCRRGCSHQRDLSRSDQQGGGVARGRHGPPAPVHAQARVELHGKTAGPGRGSERPGPGQGDWQRPCRRTDRRVARQSDERGKAHANSEHALGDIRFHCDRYPAEQRIEARRGNRTPKGQCLSEGHQLGRVDSGYQCTGGGERESGCPWHVGVRTARILARAMACECGRAVDLDL